MGSPISHGFISQIKPLVRQEFIIQFADPGTFNSLQAWYSLNSFRNCLFSSPGSLILLASNLIHAAIGFQLYRVFSTKPRSRAKSATFPSSKRCKTLTKLFVWESLKSCLKTPHTVRIQAYLSMAMDQLMGVKANTREIKNQLPQCETQV